MQLPKYHETFLPILKTLATEEIMESRKMAIAVRDNFYSELPKELLAQKTKTGANRFLDRILWGKSYLRIGKLVEYPSRGYVQITKKGKKILEQGRFSIKDLKQDADFINHRKQIETQRDISSNVVDITTENETPQELIDSGISIIEDQVKAELLEKLKEIDPYFFEKVILILLKKMGYGDFVETLKSNDGGIDGVINEDKLGLEKIYTQAKRYIETKVREKDIRDFIGAMSGDTNKGVFITTSTFDDSARKKARDAHHTIILIDGSKLVDLMFQYNVGLQVKSIYEIKELDNDFFEEE